MVLQNFKRGPYFAPGVVAERFEQMKGDAVRLPSVVERLPHYTLVDPRLLVEGDRFVFGGKTWTVAEAYEDGLYTVGDPRMYFIFS